MEFKITVTIEGLDKLTEALQSIGGLKLSYKETDPSEISDVEAISLNETPEVEVVADVSEVETVEVATPSITLDELKAMGVELSKAKKTGECRDLLNKLGLTRITEAAPSQYDELYKALGEILHG